MKYRLTTYQSKDAVEKLLKDGYLILSKSQRHLTHLAREDGKDYNHFEFPYAYMMEEMKKRLPLPVHDDAYYPIWAWYKCNGRYQCSKKMDEIHHGLVKLIIEIDENRVLLSDFDMFASIILGSRTLYEDGRNDEDEITVHNYDSFFHPTLANIFKLHRKQDHYYGFSYRGETIQATFFELYKEDIKEIIYPK